MARCVAKFYYLGLETPGELTIRADLATEHPHHKANTIGSGKALDDPTFFPRIGEALQSSEAILIVGPGNEKALLLKYLEERRHAVSGRELRADASDHPTDREIIAPGRRHFHLGEPAR